MQVRWGVLDAAQREGLDWSFGVDPLPADHLGSEALHLEIVHLIVEVEGRRMTDSTLALAEEDLLAEALLLRRLGGFSRPSVVSFGAGGKSNMFCIWAIIATWLARSGRLTFGGDHMIAVEVRGPLFELGEILHRPEGPLGAVDLLIEHAAQADGVDAEARGLRAIVRVLVERAVGVAVGVAIKAGNAQTGLVAFAVLGLVELLLGEGREE